MTLNLTQLADLAFGEIPGGPGTPDTHCPNATGTTPNSPPAMEAMPPTCEPLAGPKPVRASLSTTPNSASPAPPTLSAIDASTPTCRSADKTPHGEAQSAKDVPVPEIHALTGPILATPVLGLMADVVDDLETVRIANANRLRQLCDPTEHGHGLTPDHPQVRRLAAIVKNLEDDEHQAILELQRAMRTHPLGPWVKRTPGVGEKQAARLLAAIRDPYWNDLHDRPRTVSELWAYCGMHTVPVGGQSRSDTQRLRAADTNHPGDQTPSDAQASPVARMAPTRRRGERVRWNTQARQRVWLIAESCIKVRHSPYRDVYDQTRLKYADAVHDAPCVRCGPSGHPAEPGTPLSVGHQHGRAMRAMCKEILRDLWREAQKLHHPTDNEEAQSGA